MRGHVRKRGKSWQVIVTVTDQQTGKRRQLTGTRSTRADADKLLVQLLTEAGRSGAAARNATVADLLERWQEQKAADWSPVNVRQTRMLVDTYIAPRLGRVKLSKLKTADLDAMYRDLMRSGGRNGAPLSPGSVARVHTCMRAALSQGVKWEWVTDNCATRATLPKRAAHRIDPPSPDDVRRLIAEAGAADADFGVLLHLAASTGARRGELCALRWSDFSLPLKTVTIQRALSMGAELVERQTKTGNVRRVSLDSATQAVMKQHQQRCIARAEAAGCDGFDWQGFVFSLSPDGSTPWRPDLVTHRFVRLRRRLGLEQVRFHALRHFHVTQLLASNVDLTTVAGRVGHAGGGRTTLAVYAHFIEDSDAAAAEAIGRIMATDAVCQECGNDTATEGHAYCVDCLDSGAAG